MRKINYHRLMGSKLIQACFFRKNYDFRECRNYYKSTARESANMVQESCLRHWRGSRVILFVIFLANANFLEECNDFYVQSFTFNESSSVFMLVHFFMENAVEINSGRFPFHKFKKARD